MDVDEDLAVCDDAVVNIIWRLRALRLITTFMDSKEAFSIDSWTLVLKEARSMPYSLREKAGNPHEQKRETNYLNF